MEIKNIGINVQKPVGPPTKDKKSPFTGSVKVHGRIFEGTVISDSMQKTVTVQWNRKKSLKKFQRYEKRSSKVKAHNPSSIGAVKGDIVRIMECRPISKTKHFVVIEVIGKEKLFAEKRKAFEESRVKKEKKTHANQEPAAQKQKDTDHEE